jgi:hypothetical protein
MSQLPKSSTASNTAVGPGRGSDKPISKKPSATPREGGGLGLGVPDPHLISKGTACSVTDRRAEFMRDLQVLSDISREGVTAMPNQSGIDKFKNSSHIPPSQAASPATLPRSWEEFRSAYFPDALYSSLYPHQRDGVHWLFELHGSRHRGGILADDMGLGKTKQVT